MVILISVIVVAGIIAMVAMHLSHKKEIKRFERWRRDDTRYIETLHNRIELLEQRNESLRIAYALYQVCKVADEKGCVEG